MSTLETSHEEEDYESKLKIPLKELIVFGKGRHIGEDRVRQLAQWFVKYDKTGKGLELPEMKLIFKSMLNKHVTESIVDRWCNASFDKSDKDKSGHLEILEFLDLYLDFSAQFEEPQKKHKEGQKTLKQAENDEREENTTDQTEKHVEEENHKEAENATSIENQYPKLINKQEENDERDELPLQNVDEQNQEDVPPLKIHEQQDTHEQQQTPPLIIQQNELPQQTTEEHKQEPPQNTEQKPDTSQNKKQDETKSLPEQEKKQVKTFTDDDIRTRAYYIWLRNGQVNDRDEEYWFQAISELQQENQNSDK
jgi:chemotaxis protein histidine kinase CheA